MRKHRPKRQLEQIKGISEQKASKILAEGESPPQDYEVFHWQMMMLTYLLD